MRHFPIVLPLSLLLACAATGQQNPPFVKPLVEPPTATLPEGVIPPAAVAPLNPSGAPNAPATQGGP